MRDIFTTEPCSVLRVYLNDDGSVIARRTLGRVYNSAIKLSADEDVIEGLHVASSVEAGLAAMAQGYRPTWVAMGADAVALPGVEVTVL